MANTASSGVLARFRASGLLWPSVFTAVCLSLLIGLGTWQLQRKAWKEGLIENITRGLKAPPVGLGEAQELLATTGNVEYLPVKVTGSFDHDKERYYYAPDPRSGPGYHVYTPMIVDGDAGQVLWINRGYVPRKLRDPALRPSSQITGPVTLTGLVRLSGQREAFLPDNDANGNNWFWRDLKGMHVSAFGEAAAAPLPFFVDVHAKVDQEADDWPKGGVTIVKLPNRHLEYAFTWYGLALTLIGVFVAFARARLRKVESA